MIRSRSAPKRAPARWGGGAALLVVAALVAAAPAAGRAQSNDEPRQPFAEMTGLPVVAKGAKLMTYYDGSIPKDGYVIVPAKGDNRNFLECDRKLIPVDEKQLKDSTHPNCDMGRYDPGPIKAYIKGFGTNGDVQIVTQFGGETIAKNKWDNLINTLAKTTGGEAGSSEIKAGDFAVFDKNDQGRFATMYKLAPKIGGGS